jgi:hypothetical protein
VEERKCAHVCLQERLLEGLVVHLHANLDTNLLDLPLAASYWILNRV